MSLPDQSRRALATALLGALLLWLALAALRYGVIENQLLPRDCGPGGGDSAWSCGFAWMLTESFRFQRIGWVALLCGVLGFAFGWRRLAWSGWFIGIAGVVLYSPDYAVPGALLAFLALLRLYLPPPGRSQRQREADG